jgi:hypothetical protein
LYCITDVSGEVRRSAGKATQGTAVEPILLTITLYGTTVGEIRGWALCVFWARRGRRKFLATQIKQV